MRNLKYTYKRTFSCKQAALSIGALLGNLKGFLYRDFERKKKIYICVLSSWIQRILKFMSGGHLVL
jgi:hypothetical protein